MTVLCVLSLSWISCSMKQVADLSVRNPNDFDIHEQVIELELADINKSLHLEPSHTKLIVRDADNHEIPSQITYDGKLLFQVSLKGNTSGHYQVSAGQPVAYDTLCYGRVHPERIDDLAWENDKMAFRTYGPGLNKMGWKSHGYDAWLKYGTKKLVVDDRYRSECNEEKLAKLCDLRKTNPAEAKKWAATFSYHYDFGNGYDGYNVDCTLGAGGSALMHDDMLVYQNGFDTCKILDNGPLRFTAKLTYPALSIDGQQVIEEKIISTDAGAHLNKTILQYTGLQEATILASGIALHHREPAYKIDNTHYTIGYTDSTIGAGGVDNGALFIGMVNGQPWASRDLVPFSPEEEKINKHREFGHLMMYNEVLPKQSFTYYWGTAAEKSGAITSLDAWSTYLSQYAMLLQHPLEIEIN